MKLQLHMILNKWFSHQNSSILLDILFNIYFKHVYMCICACVYMDKGKKMYNSVLV